MSNIVEDGAYISPNSIVINSTIKKGARIEDNSKVVNSVIGEDTLVKYSVIEESEISNKCEIGNFSHIYNSKVAANSVIGHSVQVKNSVVGEHVHIKHLTYIGNGNIGNNVNVGACCVFANYDGKSKHETIVKDNSFIGSGSVLVAPVSIGEKAFVAAGSTITSDVPGDTLAIGRARQVNKLDYFKNKEEKENKE